jgi:hypothetical protein
LKNEPVDLLENSRTIFFGGVPRYVLKIKNGMATTVRADCVSEKILHIEYISALESG